MPGASFHTTIYPAPSLLALSVIITGKFRGAEKKLNNNRQSSERKEILSIAVMKKQGRGFSEGAGAPHHRGCDLLIIMEKKAGPWLWFVVVI